MPREVRTVIVAACDSKEGTRLHNRAQTLVVGVWVLGLLACLPRATNATDRVTFALSAAVMSVFGELHATVRVEPRAENRVLRIVLDGPLYYASTDVQLDGAEAARVHDHGHSEFFARVVVLECPWK